MLKRLNLNPKQRWSMLKNLTTSLFLHERLVTTFARARVLKIVAERIFCRALRADKLAYNKTCGLFHDHRCTYKIYNNLIQRYKAYAGHIVTVTPLPFRRRGDNSEMAKVELIHK